MRDAPHIWNLWESGGPFIGPEGKPTTRLTVQLPWPDLAGEATGEYNIINGVLIDPTTGRPAYTGPLGEGGFADQQPNTVSWTMPDGRTAWYTPGFMIQAGNQEALGLAVTSVLYAPGATPREGVQDFLRRELSYVGNWGSRGIPLRWWQNATNSQSEKEIPNVKVVTIDRSIETDAAQCSIEIYNVQMYNNTEIPAGGTEAGQVGYFTPDRGLNPVSQARWNQLPNEWQNLLAPNAVIRTYQGYGGDSGTIADAVTNGYLLLSGVWLVDEATISSAGTLTLKCRDMAKLLIDQQLYPPLVPADKYPLEYRKWAFNNTLVAAQSQRLSVNFSGSLLEQDRLIVFSDSSLRREFGDNFSVYGHLDTHAIDGADDTYWLSKGHASATALSATEWIEFSCGEDVDMVAVYPVKGNYTMYVSVMENGKWQGDQTVPYQPSGFDNGAAIPYVLKTGVAFEQIRDYVLPRAYKAQRVRLSFRNLQEFPENPSVPYRVGLREVRLRYRGTDRTMTADFNPFVMAADTMGGAGVEEGYWTATSFDQIDAFGDARLQELSGGARVSSTYQPTALVATKSGLGYYVLYSNGTIAAFGDATYYGDPEANNGFAGSGDGDSANFCWDMALTPSGAGYWVSTTQGSLYSFGDAPVYSNLSLTNGALIASIDAHPSSVGLWAVDANGVVSVRGAATDHGDFSPLLNSSNDVAFDEVVQAIRATPTGDGYWLLTSRGRIQAFGGATHHGEPAEITYSNPFTEGFWEILPSRTGDGYGVLNGNGAITPFGDFEYFGAPIQGTDALQRKAGNYSDYSQIIKDLALWSGFLLYDETLNPAAEPAVFGNIESTGIYSDEDLPAEMFDKRPVIDAMNELKEVVGYLLWVDDEGGFRFESPNWWRVGNYNELGESTGYIPEIDETVQLTDYSYSFNDASLRSMVIISSEDPTDDFGSTITTTYVPRSAAFLRGIVKPAMWVNGFFVNREEQQLMAELIALHIEFQRRVGQVSCIGNPALQINDQVRIYERVTGESYVHYVRGIQTTHDLDSGAYTMTLTTHWLGDGAGDGTFALNISERLATFLSANVAKF